MYGYMLAATHHVLGLEGTDYRLLIERVRNMVTDVRVACQPSSGLKRANDVTLAVVPSSNPLCLNRTKLDRFPRISPAAQPLSTTTPPAPFAVLSLSSCSAPSVRSVSRRTQSPRPQSSSACVLYPQTSQKRNLDADIRDPAFCCVRYLLESCRLIRRDQTLSSSLGAGRSVGLPTVAPCSRTCKTIAHCILYSRSPSSR